MKNIIFDLGGVIIKETPETVLKILNIEEKNMKKLKQFFKNWEKLDKGEQTLEEKLEECNIEKNIKEKYKKYLLKYYEYRKTNEELINLIKKLKKNNYKIYILSDNNKEAYNYYKKQLKEIDGWIISCEYKTIKKEEKIFKILLEKYNLKNNECYFIDDSKENIEAANKQGITGFKFDETKIEKLYENMKKHNIKI